MIDLLLLIFWLILGIYCLWYLFKAETFQPLTLDELALTWKMHKLPTGCKASRIYNLILKNDEVVGFKCECGYEFIQKRLITQKPHQYLARDKLAHLKKPDTLSI